MSRLLDGLCYLRDLIQEKNYKRLELYTHRINEIREQLIRLMKSKSENYKFELEFTAQDLREISADISNLFKYWETQMNPDKAIKALAKSKTENKVLQVNFDEWTKTKEAIMRCRTITVQPLTELLTICEFFAVYLYYVELVSNDEFAINYTERLFTIGSK